MPESVELLFRLMDNSEELEKLLGDDWPALRDRIAVLVGQLDSSELDAKLRTAVDGLIEDLLSGPASELLRAIAADVFKAKPQERSRSADGAPTAAKERPAAHVSPEPKRPEPGDPGPGGSIRVPVFFATDREEVPGAAVDKRFTSNRGTMNWGVAHVSIPAGHSKGELEGPRWWRMEFQPDPAKHVTLLDIATLERGDYVAALRDALAAADSRDALLFIHGYNVDFQSAARQTAQIAVDLEFRGRSLLYSWPSKASLLSYSADESTVEWSTPHFEDFLRMVLTEVGAETVHVLAHSMGNRALIRALERFDPAILPPGAAALRQIIFAAPDVDRAIFEQLAEAFQGRAERLTLYASKNDLAIKLSRLLHRFPRAGDADDPLIAASVDTIDASDADASLFGLGHSYFASKRSILSDVFDLLSRGTPPEQRFGLRTMTSPRGNYWIWRR